jgi:hypothetical protein
MIERAVWVSTFICMASSLLIAFGAERLWPRVVSFLAALVFSLLLFPILGWLWASGYPEQSDLIYIAFRKQGWSFIGGIAAMAWFGAWELRKKIEEALSRRQPPSSEQ